MPERFDLNYVGEDNEHRPVMIHRALYGSYERFFMMLIEHYEGRFRSGSRPNRSACCPSPTTISVTPTASPTSSTTSASRSTAATAPTERKIRAAHDDRVPYQIIVGDNEEDDGNISVRDRFEDQEYDVAIEAFQSHLEDEIEEQRTEPDFLQ